MRLGQKNGIVRQRARTGGRPRQPKDQRCQSAYLFGAVCPARGTGAAVAMPFADTHAMQTHLEEISRTAADGSHAVLLMDRAGWHTTGELEFPDNITALFLPPRSPELNPAESIWQYVRLFQAFYRGQGPHCLADVDGLFVQDPADIFTSLSDHDMGICVVPGMWHSWAHFRAAFTVFTKTESGLDFMRLVAAYISDTIQ